MDLSESDLSCNNDELGENTYSLEVLLKIILYCYLRGLNSPRRIEAPCRTNIIAKALAINLGPDHATGRAGIGKVV
jgi:transposase